ncbi:MAG: alpha/beta hydrolase [Pseudomonadota bacterium]
MNNILGTIGFIALVYLAVGVMLYLSQRNFIYFPTGSVDHDYEALTVENQGERLNIIRLNAGNRRAVLYFGGNAESVAFSGEEFQRALPEHTVYLVNYRGYGGSSGKPTEAVLYADALTLYDRFSSGHDTLAVMGRSLGSGVASYLAAQREVDKLVLITPFDSILGVAQSRFPIYPLSLLLKDTFDSASRAADIVADVLIVVAEHDDVIARVHSDRLIDAFAAKPAQVEMLSNTGHNDISLHASYYPLIAAFLQP